MSDYISDHFREYRGDYPLRNPDLSGLVSSDETEMITIQEGLREFTLPPSREVACCPDLTENPVRNESKYLWIVGANNVPFAIEVLEGRVRPSRGYLTHTNLTGGDPAHSGGELWFHDENSIIINGGSGRYPPRDEAELETIARSFKKAGYQVASMGWDTELGRPARYRRGSVVEWI